MDSRCRIYDGTGVVRTSHAEARHRAHLVMRPTPTIADSVPLAEIMTRDLVCARPELRLDALARLMIEHHIGCVPVLDDRGRPVGMVTKSDLVEHLGDFATRTAGDVMMPLAITLDEHATVAHAASLMAMEDFHHVMVVADDGGLIGVVSSKDIVRWLVENDELVGARS